MGSWYQKTKEKTKKSGAVLPSDGYGKFAKFDVSISTAPAKNDCKAKVYLHMTFNVDAAKKTGCKDEDVQAAIKAIEAALKLKWKDKKCACKKKDEKPGCSFDLEIVWHKDDSEGPKGKFNRVELDCHPFGEATTGNRTSVGRPCRSRTTTRSLALETNP